MILALQSVAGGFALPSPSTALEAQRAVRAAEILQPLNITSFSKFPMPQV